MRKKIDRRQASLERGSALVAALEQLANQTLPSILYELQAIKLRNNAENLQQYCRSNFALHNELRKKMEANAAVRFEREKLELLQELLALLKDSER